MNPDHIVQNDIVMIDANIIIYASRDKSVQCRNLIRRCSNSEVQGIMTSHILAEISHRLMLAEALEYNWISGSNPARSLAEQPERAKGLIRYELAVKNLLSVGIHFERLEKEDFLAMLRIQRETGLLTNDALLIACAERLRVQTLASADRQFSVVKNITLYSPDDIREL
jgi:predicted nucleic acid-binding protein